MRFDVVGIRKRLKEKIRERYGSVEPSVLREIAFNANLSETTVCRLVAPERYSGKVVAEPRKKTLTAVAVALDLNYAWLVEGSGSEQMNVWPVLLRQDAEVEAVSPIEELRAALVAVEGQPKEVLLSACRGAVGSLIDIIASEGVMVPPTLYRAMVRLDATRRSSASRVSAAG